MHGVQRSVSTHQAIAFGIEVDADTGTRREITNHYQTAAPESTTASTRSAVGSRVALLDRGAR